MLDFTSSSSHLTSYLSGKSLGPSFLAYRCGKNVRNSQGNAKAGRYYTSTFAFQSGPQACSGSHREKDTSPACFSQDDTSLQRSLPTPNHTPTDRSTKQRNPPGHHARLLPVPPNPSTAIHSPSSISRSRIRTDTMLISL